MSKINYIAIFIPSLMGGGAEKMMVHLANEFNDRGYSVDLLLANYKGPYLEKVNKKVQIIDLKSSRILYSIFPFIKYLRGCKPDVILSATTDANIIAVIAKYLSFTKAKIFISQRAVLSESLLQLSAIQKTLFKIMVQLTYPLAEKCICISDGVKNNLLASICIKKIKIITIYNPVITVDIIKQSSLPTNHHWLLDPNIKVIIGLGRLVHVKNFDNLIRAFSIIKSNHSNIKLLILGEGILKEQLQILIDQLNLTDDINLIGFKNNPYRYIKNSDLFVMSPLHEGFGNVLVEAMACGLPVISTNCIGGPAEILENGKWGKLVPVGDPEALAAAMTEVLVNPSAYTAIERTADFSVDIIADRYLEVLTS